MVQQPRIIITRKWPELVERRLAEIGDVQVNGDDLAMTRDDLAQALRSADVLCATVTDVLDESLLNLPGRKARLIANFGVGYNHIDIQAAQAAGIAVTNTPDVLTDATAELALALILMSARRTAEGEREVRSGAWRGWRPTHLLSTQVTGKTLGIVGMGRIGVALARRCHHGLGMTIVYCNRGPVAEATALELQARRLSLEELLAVSDVVSLNCPSTPETRHLIDASALARMQPHAHLVNTARGDVVDEQALVDALRTGVIAGAGLDVYEREPHLSPGLAQCERAVLLPHMGSGTTETRVAMGMRVHANVAAFARGEPLPDEVHGLKN